MKCRFCGYCCIKKGKRKQIQKYFCKRCKKIQQVSYIRKLKEQIDNSFIKQLHNEGMGIRSIGRIVKVSATTIIRKVKWLASQIIPAVIQEEQQVYEIDELKSRMSGDKDEGWVVYAINRKTGKAIASATGRRNKETINKVVQQVLLLNPRKIITDGYNVYPGLIPEKIHTVCKAIMYRISV